MTAVLDTSLGTPPLADAIDRHPLIVAPDACLKEVVTLMNETAQHSHHPADALQGARSNCVLVMQGESLQGIFTERDLVQLTAFEIISCVVIVEETEADDSIQYPVGIVTERDVLRFQSLGLNIYGTPAESVMSTPLFVLNPEDSLWTAHQAMEERQVRRLVVSWNWGRNLGIVTQTSILRVFDPIEMHGIIETLQRTLQQLGLNLDQVLATTIDHDTHLPAAFCPLQQSEMPNLNATVQTLQTQIEYLISQPDLTTETR
jgi:CBS domain-containing protein